MTFIKGKSGNPGGRPKGRIQAMEAFRQLLEEKIIRVDGQPSRDLHIEAIRDALMNGDSAVIRELMHYRWGKPEQHVSVGGEDGEPTGIIVQFVKPDGTDKG